MKISPTGVEIWNEQLKYKLKITHERLFDTQVTHIDDYLFGILFVIHNVQVG